jgi:cytidine deaminase
MDAALKELFEAALAARAHAHAPYSRFGVGAAVRGATGGVHAGCNVENAAYPVGTCAEAGALAAMCLAGETRAVEVVVMGWRVGTDGADAPLCTPCGGCRQRLREFMAPTALIHCAGPGGILRTFTLEELLPASFGPENL